MAYGVRQYGVREYGDGARVITDATPYGGGGGGGTDPIAAAAGGDLTFGGSGVLSIRRALATSAPLVFSGSALVSGLSVLATADVASTPANKVVFSGYATLTIEVPVVAPPSSAYNMKRVSPIMPTPTLDARGHPQ